MASDWETVPLEQLVAPDRVITYGIVQPGPPVAHGIPVVRVNDVRNGRISTTSPMKVSPKIEAAYSRTRLRGGELLLTLVGTVGETAVVPDSLRGWNTARAVGVIPVRDDVGAYWVRLALQSPEVKARIDSRLNTTVQATLNLGDVSKLPIGLPSPEERTKIIHILGTLDDKIELIRRTNQTLEAMARALFKSWFVDFDPVRAKAERRDPDLPKQIADLFPDSFEDSELGEIPKEWMPSNVGKHFNLTMGQSPPGSTYNESGDGLPFFQGRTDFGFRFPSRRVSCTAPTRLAKVGDTLVSVRAPVGDVNIAIEPCAIGRGVAAVRHLGGSRSFTYHAIHNLGEHFSKFEAEGTVFGSINKTDFERLPFVVPPQVILDHFERVASPIDERVESNERESSTLIALRDTLLPKLISGELRVLHVDARQAGAAK
jgi:type I restriction enzyme S subunit